MSKTIQASGVLSKALENANKAVADENVAKVQAEIDVIRAYKAQIKEIETKIAQSQKNIRTYDATPALSAKDVLG